MEIINHKGKCYLKTKTGYKEILASTDTSLFGPFEEPLPKGVTSPIPQPSQSFIEKFVEEYNKGNVITEVMVEYVDNGYEVDMEGVGGMDLGDTCWMEKLELKVNPKDNTITIRKVRDNFNFNREEMLNLLERAWNGGALYGSSKPNSHYFDKLIEENL